MQELSNAKNLHNPLSLEGEGQCDNKGEGVLNPVQRLKFSAPSPNSSPPGERTPYRAWVVFSGKTELPWLKFLKPGFRHCYVVLHDGMRWVTIDPLSPHTEVLVHHHLSPEFDLIGWLELRGQQTVEAVADWSKSKPAPFMLFTCVEAVKRILGIQNRSLLTPWQLYRFLTEKNKGVRQWA